MINNNIINFRASISIVPEAMRCCAGYSMIQVSAINGNGIFTDYAVTPGRLLT